MRGLTTHPDNMVEARLFVQLHPEATTTELVRALIGAGIGAVDAAMLAVQRDGGGCP